jgi:hypothetical protein
MNDISYREKQLRTRGERLEERYADLKAGRLSSAEKESWLTDADAFTSDWDDLKREKEGLENARKMRQKLHGGDDIPNPKFAKNIEGQNMSDRLTGAKFFGVDGRVIETKGAQLSPLDVDDEAFKAMAQHHRTGLPVNVKGITNAQGWPSSRTNSPTSIAPAGMGRSGVVVMGVRLLGFVLPESRCCMLIA